MAKSKVVARPKSEATVSQESYSEAVDAARLREVRLIQSDFKAEAEALGDPEPNWRMGYGCEVKETYFDAEASLLTGWVVAEATCKLGRKRIVGTKACYIVVYDLEGEPEEQAALKFVSRVGPFTVYPYFRAHFAELASQAGLRVPPLPVMKERKRHIPAGPAE
jgi:hypothetical protein